MNQKQLQQGQLAGDPKFWPFAGSENKLLSASYSKGTNNYLIPIDVLHIQKNPSSLCYVSRKNRIYFTLTTRGKTIYSQFFPNNFAKDVQQRIKIAKIKHETNQIDSFILDGYHILKLAGTSINLFAILKNGDDLFICKVRTSDDTGFDYNANEKLNIKKIENGASNMDLEAYAIDLDENGYDTNLFVLEKRTRKMYYTTFKSNTSGTIYLNDLAKELNTPVLRASSFCISMGPRVDSLFLYDKATGELTSYTKPCKSRRADFIRADVYKIPNVDFYKIEYFSIEVKDFKEVEFNSKADKDVIELLILFSESEIWTLNLDSRQLYHQLGGGYMTPGMYDGDLTQFQVRNNNFSYVINGSVIFLGDPWFIDTGTPSRPKGLRGVPEEPLPIEKPPQYGKCFALLTDRLRDVIFLNPPPPPNKINPRDYELS